MPLEVYMPLIDNPIIPQRWVKVLQVLWRGIKRTISDIKEYRRIERGRAILSDNIAKKDRRNGEFNGGRKLVEENHNDRI